MNHTPPTGSAAPPTDPMSPDDRAAVRSYLQRAETRLSTLHRVASAMLSGAGLMVLLPAIQRDTVVTVQRTLLTGPVTRVDLLLATSVLMSVLVPLIALAFVLKDLVSFYFHANHLDRPGRPGKFTPRFTLTGLKMPMDDLSGRSRTQVEAARGRTSAVELLVPDNDSTRRRIDERLSVYGLEPERPGDRGRADGLLALTASESRTLADEIAKIEYGLSRHVLGIQNIVLRYAKALLALLATILSTYVAAAVVESGPLDAGARAWVAVVLMVWTVLTVVAVVTPLRWIEERLRADGAARTAVARDDELTSIERMTIGLAVAGHLTAGAGLALLLVEGELATSVRWGGGVVAGISSLILVGLLTNWIRRRRAGGA